MNNNQPIDLKWIFKQNGEEGQTIQHSPLLQDIQTTILEQFKKHYGIELFNINKIDIVIHSDTK